jgi:hypothetical protein
MTSPPLPPEVQPVDNAELHGTGKGGGPRESREARVRRVLIGPLEARGLRRRKRATAAEHAAFLERLVRRLAYLGEDHLLTLAGVIERNAGGPDRAEWPAEVSIVNWAAGLEVPPDEDERLVPSYLRSAAGRAAWEEGPEVAVALRAHLRRWHRPPMDGDHRAIRRQAADWAHEQERIAENIRAGRASAAQLARAEAWRATVDRVRSMVFANAEEGAE